MRESTIEQMLDALRPVLRSRPKAKTRLQQYWSDMVALIWTTNHVHTAANEKELAMTEDEAKQVLKHLLDAYDSQEGVKWQDLTFCIQDCALGRKLTSRELHRFVHQHLITIEGR